VECAQLASGISASGKSLFYRPAKRIADIVLAVPAIVMFFPVLIVMCVMIKCDSAGPAIFRQERMGRGNRRFIMYKLRTMVNDAEQNGPLLAVADDRRMTRIGRFLRRYHIDELPQLWNVLKGDMSIVGPRPEREHFARLISDYAPEYSRISSVRPGLTSWGNVMHGYASDIQGMVVRLRYDLDYLDNMSPYTDLKVIFYTIKILITGKGI